MDSPRDLPRNTLRARLICSFKGDTFDLDTRIDLDAEATDAEETPDFHRLLAKAAGIDTYSYLYEVLESHDIEFSEPTGLAALCCHDGGFDWQEYVRLRQEADELQTIRAIAAQALGLTDLDQHANLKSALLAAYRAGQRQAN